MMSGLLGTHSTSTCEVIHKIADQYEWNVERQTDDFLLHIHCNRMPLVHVIPYPNFTP